MEMSNNDMVYAWYKDSRYYGKLSKIDPVRGSGVITVSEGVSMLLPLADMALATEVDSFDGTD